MNKKAASIKLLKGQTVISNRSMNFEKAKKKNIVGRNNMKLFNQ